MKNVLVILGLSLLAFSCGKSGSKSTGVPVCQPGQFPGTSNCVYQNMSCQGMCGPGMVQTPNGQCYPVDNSCNVSGIQQGCGYRLNNICQQGQMTQTGYPYQQQGYPYYNQYPYQQQYQYQYWNNMYAPPNYQYYNQPRCQTTSWGFYYCTYGF